MFKIWKFPQQMRMARCTSTQQQSESRYLPTLIGNVYLPFSNRTSYFLPQPASFMSSLASLSSLTFSLKIKCPSQNKTILSPQHMTMPKNSVCHSQLIHGFTQAQHVHRIIRSWTAAASQRMAFLKVKLTHVASAD